MHDRCGAINSGNGPCHDNDRDDNEDERGDEYFPASSIRKPDFLNNEKRRLQRA